MKEFEIYFDDLTPEAQQNYLDFAEVEYAEELNHESIPIAIIEIDTEGL